MKKNVIFAICVLLIALLVGFFYGKKIATKESEDQISILSDSCKLLKVKMEVCELESEAVQKEQLLKISKETMEIQMMLLNSTEDAQQVIACYQNIVLGLFNDETEEISYNLSIVTEKTDTFLDKQTKCLVMLDSITDTLLVKN